MDRLDEGGRSQKGAAHRLGEGDVSDLPEIPGAGAQGRTDDPLITSSPQAPTEDTQDDLSLQELENLE